MCYGPYGALVRRRASVLPLAGAQKSSHRGFLKSFKFHVTILYILVMLLIGFPTSMAEPHAAWNQREMDTPLSLRLLSPAVSLSPHETRGRAFSVLRWSLSLPL